MQFIMRLSQIATSAVFLLYAASAFSQDCRRSELNLSGGYRSDTYKRDNTTKSDSHTTIQKDTIDINHINIWQVGVNGRAMMPGFENCFARNFFLSGFAYWGWKGAAGKLHEPITSFTGAGKQNGKARLDKVDTRDFQLGLGYLFNWKHWNFGLSSGFAYDKQNIKTRSGKISYPSGAPYIDAPIYGIGYQTVTKWWGPWIGTEIEYCRSLWRVSTGYEIHFADYSAHHTIPNNFIARLQGVESKTRSSQAYGNVVFLEGDYRFCKGWKVGSVFAYQHWQANHGHLKSDDFKLDGTPSSTKVSSTARWIAYGMTLDIGYTF